MPLTLGQLAEKWKDAPPGERAQLQSYIIELCQALGVEPPGLKGSGYEFELAITGSRDRASGRLYMRR